MRAWRQTPYILLFLVTLVFCSVMVIRQINLNQSRHLELREAFVLLYNRGYIPESQRLYYRLLRELPGLSDKAVLDDFQRTLMLVDPTAKLTNNLIYDYHWTVSNELERRSAKALLRALKLAEAEK
jgi:hypothetical protein